MQTSFTELPNRGEPVWPSGKAVRLVSRGPRFESALALSLQAVIYGHCFVPLSLTGNETLKSLSLLPILIQESFWW